MAATRGRGSKIRVKTTSGSYVDIAGLRDITVNPPENETIDVTDQDTPAGSRRLIPGDVSPGSVTADLNFDVQEQSHLLLMNSRKSGALLDFQVKIAGPGNKRMPFSGYVRGLPFTLPVNNPQSMSLTIDVDGDFGDPEADT